MNIEKFLELLYPNFNENNNLICIRPFYIHTQKPQYIKLCKTTDEIISHVKTVKEWNRHNIFFQCPELFPDAKNGREENCLRWPFLYADLDPYEKNISGTIIKTFSKDQLKEKINDFPLYPSLTVDSGYGFHLYWLLDRPITEKEVVRDLLVKIQKRLSSDRQAILLTQLLRVPETMNLKSAPAPVSVVDFSKRKYSPEEIAEKLQSPAANTIQPTDVRTQKVFTGHTAGYTAKSFQDLLNYIKKQDICSVLSIPATPLGTNFRCLFHDDHNPSANIYQHADTGYYYYKCFGCGKHADIIQIYSEKNNTSFYHSVYGLAKHFGIDYRHSEWINRQYEKYHRNAIFTEEFDTYGFDVQYPLLYKYLYEFRDKKRLQCLLAISHYAYAKLNTEEYQHGGESLFFFSYEYFAKKYGLNLSTLKDCVTFFLILGFLNKIATENVPDNIAQEAYEQNEKKKKKYNLKILSPVNFYTIPLFFDMMAAAEEKLKVLISHNYKMKTCNNKTFLIRIGWTDVANKVFPDERTITKKSVQIANSLEATLKTLIESQGYTTKKQVIAKTNLPGKFYANTTRKNREFDRFFSQIAENNNLKQIRAKSEHAKKFNLKGYPLIIIST